MKITAENYGIYIVDYYDGTLDKEGTEALMRFLDAHPVYREELEMFAEINVEPDDAIVCPCTQNLMQLSDPGKGEISKENYKGFFALSVGEAADSPVFQAAERFVAENPAYAEEYRKYGLTKLQADDAIVFPDKEKLMKALPLKKTASLRMIYRYSAAAVVALVFVSSYFVFRFSGDADLASGITAMRNTDLTTREVIIETGLLSAEPSAKTTSGGYDDIQPSKRSISPIEAVAVLSYTSLPEQEVSVGIQEANRDEFISILRYQEIIASRISSKVKEDEFLNLGDYGRKQIRRIAGTADENLAAANDRLGFWDVAGLGVAAYNSITGNDVALTHRRNSQGKINDFALGNIIGFSRNRK